MSVIAVINQKGGVGKTACAINIAYQLSQMNKITCLIDLDPSANASRGFNILAEAGKTSYEFLLKKDSLLDYAQHIENSPNLTIVPSSIRLAMAQRDLNNKPFRETLLAKKLSDVYVDYFMIDCSPTLSDLTINAIYAANLILIPVTYEDEPLEGLADLFKVINEIKDNQKFIFKIVRNQKDARKTKTNEYIENRLADFIVQDHVLKTIIRQDENINQAKIERKTIFEYAPNSNGAIDFKNLTEELINV